eukprot:GSMAST32.ASY1.ANO1.2707.1 assembled CDS
MNTWQGKLWPYTSQHIGVPHVEDLLQFSQNTTKRIKLRARNLRSDKNEEEFNEYYGEQPWAALPFASRDLKEKISQKFKIRGIPSLIILDTDGSVITKDGREAVTNDPEGVNFPWRPLPLDKLLGSEFVGQDGKKLGIDAIKGKVIGIYFSAHWC